MLDNSAEKGSRGPRITIKQTCHYFQMNTNRLQCSQLVLCLDPQGNRIGRGVGLFANLLSDYPCNLCHWILQLCVAALRVALGTTIQA